VGIDLGGKAIERAKKIAHDAGIENVEFRTGSVLELPFEDDTFDFVYCNGVLHHTDNMEQGIAELYRVMKPYGPAWLYLYAAGGLFWYARERMNVVMKRIPRDYAIAVLNLIGMPKNRFIFADNWYVPHERHSTREELEHILKETGFSKWEAVASKRSMDFDKLVVENAPQAREMYGDGQLRYFVWK
jgi:ubiquinone/menaquinone biosynthesis C-methylase UbiE